MGHIQEIYPELEGRGLQVAVILPQKRDPIREWLREHALSFPLLVDEGREASREYGVYVRADSGSAHSARPGVFILDGEGAVRYVFLADEQREHPEDADIFATLDAMGA